MIKKIKEKFSFLKFIDPFYYVDLYILPRINKEENEIVSLAVYFITAFITAWFIYFLLGLILNTSAPLVVVVSGSMQPTLYRGDIIVLQGVPSSQLKGQELRINYPTLDSIKLSDISQTICEDNQGNINDCDYFRKLVLLKLMNIKDFNTKEIVFSGNKKIKLNKKGDIIVYFLKEKGIPVIHRIALKIKADNKYYFLTKGDSINNPLIDQDSALSLYPLPENEVVGKAIFRIPLLGYIKLLLVDDIKVLLFGCPKGMTCILP